MRTRHTILLGLAFIVVASVGAQQPAEPDRVAALSGEPRSVSAAGVTRSEKRLVTLENASAFDQSTGANLAQRRLVIVAGLDGDMRAASAALGAVEWFKTRAPKGLRDRWIVSALPLADPDGVSRAAPLVFPPVKGFFDHPEQPESRYVWRWAAYQAPDLLLEIRGGDSLTRGNGPANSLSAAMSGGSSDVGVVPAVFATARATDGPALLEQVLTGAGGLPRSALHTSLASRVARPPLAIARLLAARYPQNPLVSYIPSVAWANTLRLSDVTQDEALRRKVLEQTRPWLSRQQPLFGERIVLTAIAGTLIYADLAARGEQAAGDLAVQGAEAAARVGANGIAQHGQGWTDDMFMMGAILGRSGTMPGRSADLDRLAERLISYARRLQREDGIFIHFTAGPHAWGRGNGFAALGLMEALTSMPAAHPSRAELVTIVRRHMSAMTRMQAPDGMWRQVVDEPGAFREESVTAMTLTAMARGVRLGWLDETYRPVIERAWRALAAHVTEDGGIVDVCTGTGAGPTLRYYLDRAAIADHDDRGGAMALLAAMEMYELGQ